MVSNSPCGVDNNDFASKTKLRADDIGNQRRYIQRQVDMSMRLNNNLFMYRKQK